jgi:chromate transporter
VNPFEYFWLFLKASLLSTGGLGNLPFLHTDLIDLGWAGESDFLTAIAVGQLSPGPTGLWSISLGYLTFGWLGAGLALAALSLPPLLVLGVNAFYNRIENLKPAQDFMRGLSLGIIGLTLAVTFGLAGASVVDVSSLLIAMGAFALALSKKVPAVFILILAAVVGCILYG